eukprot:scaffold117511_cov66-Phaeocystis_antarctica.AAC.4
MPTTLSPTSPTCHSSRDSPIASFTPPPAIRAPSNTASTAAATSPTLAHLARRGAQRWSALVSAPGTRLRRRAVHSRCAGRSEGEI